MPGANRSVRSHDAPPTSDMSQLKTPLDENEARLLLFLTGVIGIVAGTFVGCTVIVIYVLTHYSTQALLCIFTLFMNNLILMFVGNVIWILTTLDMQWPVLRPLAFQRDPHPLIERADTDHA